VAVSPVLKPKALCIKKINEEGGMGICFYKNALEGGDWIIHELMENANDVAKLLPASAPLSNFRVMSTSRLGIDKADRESDAIEAISCVFRAGRAGASTDHSSVLFDMDFKTGKVRRSRNNMQWYTIGPQHMWPWGDVQWAPPPDVTTHPDTGNAVSGIVDYSFNNGVRSKCFCFLCILCSRQISPCSRQTISVPQTIPKVYERAIGLALQAHVKL
jgi:hypothetical protein